VYPPSSSPYPRSHILPFPMSFGVIDNRRLCLMMCLGRGSVLRLLDDLGGVRGDLYVLMDDLVLLPSHGFHISSHRTKFNFELETDVRFED
jgi:hypothetical protein